MNCKGVCVVLLASVAIVSSLPFNEPPPLVDCGNLALIQRLKESAIPFNCLPLSPEEPPHDDPSLNEIIDLQNDLSRFRGQPLAADGPEITLILDAAVPEEELATVDCTDPERCGFEVEEVVFQPCPVNSVFVAEIGQCMPMPVAMPSEREEYFNPNSEVLNDNPCSEGFIYNLDHDMCLPNKKRFSVASSTIQNDEGYSSESLENPSFGSTLTDCGEGSIFVSEVGICLPLAPERPLNTMPQNTEHVAVEVESPSRANCPAGTLFSPEVGICMVIQKMPQEMPQALALVRDSKLSASQNSNTWIEKRKCEKGTIYVSEIDLCLPVDKERPQGDAPFKPDSFRPTMAPLTSEKVGASKCSEHEVYVSEIDLCLDPLTQVNPPL